MIMYPPPFNSSRRRTLSFSFSLLISFCLVSACSPADTPQNEQPSGDAAVSTKTQHDPLVTNGNLGEGVDMSEPPSSNRATNEQCADITKRVRGAERWQIESFYTFKKSDKSRVIDQRIDGQVNVGKIGLNSHFDYFYDGAGTKLKKVFTMLLEYQTVVRDFTTPADPASKGYCSQNDFSDQKYQPWTIVKFRDACGTGMITKEYLGGYLAISVRVNKLTTEQTEKLDSVFSVGEDDTSGKVKITLDESTEKELKDVRFHMSAVGPLGPGNIDTVSSIKPGEIVDYINTYQNNYTDALNRNKYNSRFYGIVKNQKYNQYNTEVYADCNVTSAQNALNCHNDFQKTSKTFLEDREELKRRKRKAEWKLKNKSRVNWRNGKETIIRYRNTLRNIQSCFEKVREARTECREAFEAVDLEKLCGTSGRNGGGGGSQTTCACNGACTMPECTDDWRTSSDFTLPRAEVRPPNSNVTVDFHPIGSNTTDGLEPHHDQICVLSGVQGGFFGGGEAVGIKKGRDDWQLFTETRHPTEHEKLSAEAACVSRKKFENGNGGFVVGSADAGTDTGYNYPAWSTKMAAAKVHNDSYTTKKTKIGTNPDHATALIGLRGHMSQPNHGGYVLRKRNPTENKILALTDDWGSCRKSNCYMRTRGLDWGLDISKRPNDVTFGPRTAQTTTSDGYDKTKLLSSDKGFCYLTHVVGDFDGPSEKAYLTIENGYWYLHANAACLPSRGWRPWKSGCDYKKVKAKASCYYYDQTQQP